MKKHIISIGMFTLLLIQTALNAYILPTSSIWQGAQNYTNPQNGIQAYVEYAVYKSNALPSKIDLPDGASGSYVYVYEVWNNSSISMASIAALQVISGKGVMSDWIGSMDDGDNGLIPDKTFQSSDKKTFEWQFEGGVFTVNKHSAYLAFTSNYAPVAGKINLLTQLGDEPSIPGESQTTEQNAILNPEPATITLLTVGIFSILRKKK